MFWIWVYGVLDRFPVFLDSVMWWFGYIIGVLDLGLWCFGNVASVFRFGSVVFWICCQCFWVCLIRSQWF